jgi:hemerythrin-like metal-binding protein
MDINIVVWDDAYSVGLSVIDDQHKNLVNMLNDILQLDQNGNGDEKKTSTVKAAYATAFKKAAEYAKTHFHDEEAILEKAGYPDLLDHKKEHASFMTKVWDEYSLFNEGKSSPTGLAAFLKKWLLNHIAIKNKKYSSYVAE